MTELALLPNVFAHRDIAERNLRVGASIITISFLQAAAIVLRSRWQIHAPIPPEPIALLSPFVSKILWTTLALLFILGT